MGTNYRTLRQAKPKLTTKKLDQLSEEFREYNRWLAGFGQPKITMDQYVAQVFGLNKPNVEFRPLVAKPNQIADQAMKHRDQYPSLQTESTSNCERRESPKYTGTLIKGISTMHKSNAVPVLSQDEMITHANMRR